MQGIYYKQRNSANMHALIAHLTSPNPTRHQISYRQAGWIVLLGDNHLPGDVTLVETAIGSGKSSGTLQVYLDKTKRMLQPTQHRVIVVISPEESNATRRAELEKAIVEAIQGTSVSGWPVIYQWMDS